MSKGLSCVFLLMVELARGATPFVNLDFEEVNTNNIVPYNPSTDIGFLGPTSELLPGWTLLNASSQVEPIIGYDLTVGEPEYVTIMTYSPLQIPSGRHFLYLTKPGYSIIQEGEVPSNAQKIRFLSGLDTGIFTSHVSLSIDGTEIPLVAESPGSGIFSYVSGDISMFSGRSVEMKFLAMSSASRLDNITFVVPEPSVWPSFVLGALGFFARFVYRRARKAH